MTDTADRRTLLADAAIETLARSGLRGLTHRAVDQTAGLPEGSCSNHFRTRESLLEAAVHRLAELDTDELATEPVDNPAVDEIADILNNLVGRFTTTDRDRMLARYELALESTRRTQLRTALIDSGARIRAIASELFAELGAPAPEVRAHAFVACLDGLIFDQLAGAGTPDRYSQHLNEIIRILLRSFIS
ncbi:TetR/AcrR family transcriptional regulator [Nocardia sp. NPDC051990]|uniref:TetR/AcrR family transcriptional regulator n=1 Tax=Nocardia sp. NPDC051990 TaxID=3155285 RepID=UPI0034494A26